MKKAECESFPWGKKADKVDYGVMYESRYKLLKIAFERVPSAQSRTILRRSVKKRQTGFLIMRCLWR